MENIKKRCIFHNSKIGRETLYKFVIRAVKYTELFAYFYI
jgi:hypothetical protein